MYYGTTSLSFCNSSSLTLFQGRPYSVKTTPTHPSNDTLQYQSSHFKIGIDVLATGAKCDDGKCRQRPRSEKLTEGRLLVLADDDGKVGSAPAGPRAIRGDSNPATRGICALLRVIDLLV